MGALMFHIAVLLLSIVLRISGEENETVINSQLYFGLMLSLSGDQQSTGALAGVQAALDDINNRDDLLPGYSLHYTLTDSKCNRSTALDMLFIQLFDSPHPKVALVELECSGSLAEISNHFNIIHLSNGNEPRDHVRLPNYFQLLPSEVHLARVFYSIIKEYGWRRVAMIVQNKERYKQPMNNLMKMLADSMIVYSDTYFDKTGKLLGKTSPFDTQYRVYVLAMDADSAVHYLCEAHSFGIKYPKYTFLTYGSYEFHWWTNLTNNRCKLEDIEDVLEYSLAASHLHHEPSTHLSYDLYYDATWSLAYALHGVVYDELYLEAQSWSEYYNTEPEGDGSAGECFRNWSDYKSDWLASEMKRHLLNTNFKGKSGSVSFDNHGDREVGKLRVFQYRTTYPNGTRIIFNGGGEANASRVKLNLLNVAIVKQEDNDTLEFTIGDKDTIWPGPIPYDGTPRERLATIFLPITVIFSVLNICGIICGVVCLLFNIIFRNKRIIRLNSPNLNYLMISGSIMIFVSDFFFVIPTIDSAFMVATCIIRVWLVAIGHSLGFGTVIAKLWRIYLIFKHPRIAQRKSGIKDWHLVVIVLCLLLVDVVMLTAYTFLEGFVAHFNVGTESNKENPSDIVGEQEIDTVYYVTTCSVSSWVRMGSISLIHFYKFMLHICALYFAFQTRHIEVKAINDAKYIMLFIYTASVILAIAAVSSIVLQQYINAYAAVYSLGIWLGSFTILVFLFIPKMVMLYKDPDGDDVFPVQSERQVTLDLTQCGQQDFVDVDAFKHRIKQLEKELMKYTEIQNRPSDSSNGPVCVRE